MTLAVPPAVTFVVAVLVLIVVLLVRLLIAFCLLAGPTCRDVRRGRSDADCGAARPPADCLLSRDARCPTCRDVRRGRSGADCGAARPPADCLLSRRVTNTC